MDGDDDATLGRTIELGEHHARDVDGVGELLGLTHAVLARGGVDHEQRLGDGTGALLGHPADLRQLLHEVGLCLQTAGRVGQYDVGVAGVGRLDGIEHHRRRVGALGTADDRHIAALGPHGELFGGGRTERVAGGEHDFRSGVDLAFCELADRGGFADTVDADEQPHRRAGLTARRCDIGRQGAVEARQPLDQLGLYERREFGRIVDALLLDLGLHRLHDLGRGSDTDIGTDQRFFERLPGVTVDTAGEDATEEAAEG